MAHTAHVLAESALWHLLGEKHTSFEQIETELSMARGSVPMHKATLRLFARTANSALDTATTIVVTLTPLVAGPLVDKVYDRSEVAQELNSKYQVGGGIGRIYAQVNPPISTDAESMSSYVSWAKGLSEEPLPEVRR